MDLWFEVEGGPNEIGGRDGGCKHEDGLSGVCEGCVNDGVDLLKEGEGVLGLAFGHLHALEPYLDGRGDTWWSWSLVGCMLGEYYKKGTV